MLGTLNQSDYYRTALRRVYRIALDGNWKCDRAIRRVCSTRIRVITKSNDVVQSCRFERDFAMIIADFCRGYSRRYVERGDPPLVFAPETETLLAELHERTEAEYRREAVRRANDCRLLCASHRNGFCSPFKPSCPHFRTGSCVALDPDDTTTPLPPPPPEAAQ